MYSVNVPVPGRVREFAEGLYPELTSFETIRDEHTLLLKRLGEDEVVSRLQRRLHRALAGSPAVEVQVTGIEYFADPPLGSAPVVYLAVESPGLETLHRRLVEEFGAVADLEGEAYVPHVTLARGGDVADARRLADRADEPIRWTVTGVELWDGTYRLPVSRYPLPA